MGEFDPVKWREHKYEGQELVFLSQEEYQAELGDIVRIITSTLESSQIEFLEDLNTSYDIVGVVIYGSFARGDVHNLSDLDILSIASQEPHDLVMDFAHRLKYAGIGRDISSQDMISIILDANTTKTRASLVPGVLNMIESGKIIVSPDTNIIRFVEQVLAK